MIIYKARQEVLNQTRSRHIWPKELQLISRLTDKQVKKLASIYNKGASQHRVEPFEDNGATIVSNERTNTGIVDLTKPSAQGYDPSIMSPKATHNLGGIDDATDSTSKQKVPIAQIVIPSHQK